MEVEEASMIHTGYIVMWKAKDERYKDDDFVIESSYDDREIIYPTFASAVHRAEVLSHCQYVKVHRVIVDDKHDLLKDSIHMESIGKTVK